MQRRVQRHQAAVDLGAHAVVTNLGVHGVGKVNRRRAFDQGDHPTLGRKDVDLVLAEVQLQGLEERDRVVLFLADIGQALHPGNLLSGGPFLVAPVGGNAEFGPSVHLVRAHLDFDALAPRTNDGRVQ